MGCVRGDSQCPGRYRGALGCADALQVISETASFVVCGAGFAVGSCFSPIEESGGVEWSLSSAQRYH